MILKGAARSVITRVAMSLGLIIAAGCTKYELAVLDPAAIPKVKSVSELIDLSKDPQNKASLQELGAHEGAGLAHAQARVWEAGAAMIQVRPPYFTVDYKNGELLPLFKIWLYMFKGKERDKWFGVTVVKGVDAATGKPKVRIQKLGFGVLAEGTLDPWLPIPDEPWVCDPGAEARNDSCAASGELFAFELAGKIRPLWRTQKVEEARTDRPLKWSHHIIDLGTGDTMDDQDVVEEILSAVDQRPDLRKARSD